MPTLELARGSNGRTSARRRSTNTTDAVVREVLWSTSFHRFFGGQVDRERLPREVRPLSCGQASRELATIVDVDKEPVRRCLGQMLASGYVPDPHNGEQFRELAKRAMEPEADTEDDALRGLRDRGLRECGKSGEPPTAPRAADGAIEEAGTPGGAPPMNAKLVVPRPLPLSEQSIVSPTVVKFKDGVFTVTTEIFVPRVYEEVSQFIAPNGWRALGPFWRTIEERWESSSEDRSEGTVYEHFVFNWNRLVEQEYKVLLRATQRTKPGTTRIDYSLICEEQGRILVDEGYGLAMRMGDPPTWTKYVGVKTLKFASSLLNLLSPAVMAMYLETQASGLHKAVLQ